MYSFNAKSVRLIPVTTAAKVILPVVATTKLEVFTVGYCILQLQSLMSFKDFLDFLLFCMSHATYSLKTVHTTKQVQVKQVH